MAATLHRFVLSLTYARLQRGQLLQQGPVKAPSSTKIDCTAIFSRKGWGMDACGWAWDEPATSTKMHYLHSSRSTYMDCVIIRVR